MKRHDEPGRDEPRKRNDVRERAGRPRRSRSRTSTSGPRGADGQLRIAGMPELSGADPPARADLPVLPQPRHRRARPCPVRAHSRRFTVNHRFGFPGPATALRRRPGRRSPRTRGSGLTTNIVECDPDDLELGQPVEVVFEQLADVLAAACSRPSADRPRRLPSRVDEIAPQDFGKHVRPHADHREVRGQARRSPASARRSSAGG